MSGFEPVFLPAGRELGGKASQTFLRHYNQCPRSAYLYALYKGEAHTSAMVRGSALHEVCERATLAMVVAGEETIPPELVKAIVDEVLVEYPVPLEEHDYLREMAYRFGREWTVDPVAVIACETLFVWEVAGWKVRAKIDYAGMLDAGRKVEVVDFKSARAAAAYEDISRRRPDGSAAAKAFQLVLYALVLAFGVPVREEVGPDGERVEVPEPFPVAGAAQEFHLEYAYPGIKVGDDEQMLRRGVTLTRRELEEYRGSIEAMMLRLSAAEVSGDWPAIVSDGACSECPASPLCPIPAELRDHRGEINTLDQAREAATVLDRRRAEDAAIRKELKVFCEAHDVTIRFGADKEWRFVVQESTRIADKEGMFEAVDRAVRFGEPFEAGRFVKDVVSTNFKDVRLSGDELAAEAAEREVSDGSE